MVLGTALHAKDEKGNRTKSSVHQSLHSNGGNSQKTNIM